MTHPDDRDETVTPKAFLEPEAAPDAVGIYERPERGKSSKLVLVLLLIMLMLLALTIVAVLLGS